MSRNAADWRKSMIFGAHVLLYSNDPEADRAFFRDILQLKNVDVGGGWLIFALPPSEIAVHPSDGTFAQKHGDQSLLGALVYLMCDDVRETVNILKAKNVACGEIDQEPWGIKTTVRLPSGGAIGLYQPLHQTAFAR
jgi:catechol 2,3-dioxygenase-like lactoylglutathione lyase family enzyme